jgi:hypothetical protein
MGPTAAPVTSRRPRARRNALRSTRRSRIFRGAVEANELGLWRATDGTLTALVNIGPINPLEFAEVTSSKDVLTPIATATGGGVWRIAELGNPSPRVIPVRSGERFAGPDWLGLKLRDVSVVRGLGLFPLFAGLSGLLLLLAGVAAAWAREGR